MQNQASEIVKAYFEALSAGDEGRLAQILSDDFKEIGARLEVKDRSDYLKALHAAPGAGCTILDMRAVGDVVRVSCQNGAAPPNVQTRVFALDGEKIMLEVRLEPEAR
jgi:hypothetical protein